MIFQRRDNEAGRGRGRGGGGFDRMGGGGGGGGGGGPRGDYQDRGGPGRGWDNNGRGPGDRNADKAEATFSVPAAKCGVIIGRGNYMKSSNHHYEIFFILWWNNNLLQNEHCVSYKLKLFIL